MKINFLSVTFWFNIYDKHKEFLDNLQETFQQEYSNYNISNYTDNYLAPIVSAINNDKKTNFTFSQINFQYNMDNATFEDLKEFKEKILNLFNLFVNNNIEILHSAVFVNGDIIDNDALNRITKKTISSSFVDDDLIDITLKIGKKYEDLFYRIVSILNKKQIKLAQKKDDDGRIVPIPITPWYNAEIENHIIEVSYEINDKYLFDNQKDYHTTEFYLNKMLYIFTENMQSDIENVLENGEF